MSIHFVNSMTMQGGINPVPFDPDATSLKNARIGYRNILQGGSASIGAAAGLLTYDTWQRWRPTGASTATLFAGTAAQVDYVAIGAGYYAGVGLTIEVGFQGQYTQVYNDTPSDDKAIMILLDNAVNCDAIRISCDAACEIGVAFTGLVLEMQRPCSYGGHSPIVLSARTEFNNSVSDSGQWLGRSITRRGVESSYDWQLLTEDFVRDKFMPFVEHAKTKPFFMAWRPDFYPNDVVYGWTSDDITPDNRGGGTRFMGVSMNVTGHDDR